MILSITAVPVVRGKGEGGRGETERDSKKEEEEVQEPDNRILRISEEAGDDDKPV